MADAWDADDFEPEAPTNAGPSDRWEGEDEDDDVKDAWDKSDDEDDSKGDDKPKAVQRKKKKKIGDIIAEKEAAKEAQLDAKASEEAKKKALNTPEARNAEKLRLLKMEENANLQLAKDMMGLSTASGIDSMVPVSKSEFENFQKALVEKISAFNNSDHYNDFMENLVKELCIDLNTATLKKIKMSVEALHSTKLKEEKAAKAKKGKPSKGGSLRMDTTKELYGDDGGYDDMDDFM